MRAETTRVGVLLLAVASVLGACWASEASATIGEKKYSDADCQVLIAFRNDGASIAGPDPEDYAEQATGFAATAKQLKDKKLKRALRTLANVHKDASQETSESAAYEVTVNAGKKFRKAAALWTLATGACTKS